MDKSEFKTSEEIKREVILLEVLFRNSGKLGYYKKSIDFKQKLWLSKEEHERDYIPKSRVEELLLQLDNQIKTEKNAKIRNAWYVCKQIINKIFYEK